MIRALLAALLLAAPAWAETPPAPRPARVDLPVLVIDPGHGGRDPGAQSGAGTGDEGLSEADLMLAFATELADAVAATGTFDVRLTRDADVFVPLDARLAVARGLDADVFVSLHADALPDGAAAARGATVYTLADGADAAASARLVERHEGGGLGTADLTAADGDEIALVLQDLARTETRPRSDALADRIVEAFRSGGLAVAGRPRRAAAFSVLKSADVPSVLVELGFLSSETDRARLATPEGRAPAAAALAEALAGWWADDLSRRDLRGR